MTRGLAAAATDSTLKGEDGIGGGDLAVEPQRRGSDAGARRPNPRPTGYESAGRVSRRRSLANIVR
ncbi:MAG: hypothetical protein ACE5GX_17675, partial [Thermoanaerobaculia bacterium]